MVKSNLNHCSYNLFMTEKSILKDSSRQNFVLLICHQKLFYLVLKQTLPPTRIFFIKITIKKHSRIVRVNLFENCQ